MCREATEIDRLISCAQVWPQYADQSKQPATKSDVQDLRQDFRDAMQVHTRPNQIVHAHIHSILSQQGISNDFSFQLQEMREMMQAFNARLDRLEQTIDLRLSQQDQKIEAIQTEMRATRCKCAQNNKQNYSA